MQVDPERILVYVLVGAASGWAAAWLLRRRRLGLLGNLVVGIVGAFAAGWLFARLGVHISGGWLGLAVQAFVGAVLLLGLLNALRR